MSGTVTGRKEIGNISTKSDVQNGSPYSYLYYNKPHAVRSVGGITLDYDANGNMIRKVDGGVTTTIQWNFDNKPTSITRGGATTTFTYDGNSQRVRKVSPNQTVLYFGALYETRGGAWIIHLFAGRQRVASVIQGGYTQMYHPDHLGSTWMVTDLSGAIKEKDEYYPFGTYRAAPETFHYDLNFPMAYYTFTGQEDDDEVSVFNFKARLYDPLLGRFISPDSIVQEPGDPQSHNRYSYALNNPLLYRDPNGQAFTPFHMLAEIPGSTLGWLLGSGPNPLTVAYNNYVLDFNDMNNLSQSASVPHATAWPDPVTGLYATRGEALSAAWDSFTGNVGNVSTSWKANHTSYDILTHWGCEWRGFSFQDRSTWLPAAAHLIFNDIILGVAFFPVAVVESVATNVYSSVRGWFVGGTNAAGGGLANEPSLQGMYGGFGFGAGLNPYGLGADYLGTTNYYDVGESYVPYNPSYNTGYGDYGDYYDYGDYGDYDYGDGDWFDWF